MSARFARAALAVGLAPAIWPAAALADVFQLTRADDGAFVSDALVRIDSGPGVDAYTDQLGRVVVNLPPGEYSASVEVGGRPQTFRLEVDGGSQLKVYRLPF